MEKMSLDQKILSLALNDSKFAMELTSATKHSYYSPNMQWLFIALNHYFSDPNIKSILSRDMLEEYIGDAPGATKFLNTFDTIKSASVESNEFSWLLDKLKFRYNDTVQAEITSKIDELRSKNILSKERIDEINKALKQSVAEIDAIHKSETYTEGTLRDSAVDRAKRYNYIEAHPEAAQGILSGFSTFDRITNGLHAGEFMIIAGDTASGKSVVMHNYAVNAYLGKNKLLTHPDDWDDSGKNILYFTLEMPKDVQERRIDSCIGEIYSNHIRDGLLGDVDKKKYFRVLEFQRKYPKHFHIVDMPKGATTRDIELKYIEVCETGFKPDMVVVDYMGIMSPNTAVGQDWMDLGIISAELHEFARIYEVAVVTGSQVNKTKDGVERYDTSRIARSGMITASANIIIQIAKRPDEDIRTDLLVYITKMRDGEKTQFTLSKDFGRMRVIDIVDDSYTNDGESDNDII